MTDFAVDIRCDSSTVETSLRKVSTEMDRAERAAKQAETAIKKAVSEGSISWTKAAEAQKQLTSRIIESDRAAEKLAQRTQSFAAQVAAAGQMRGFDGLSAHFERVADVVERIRGPLRDHQQQMLALSTAYHTGAINAREYTTELERMRRSQQGAGVSSGVVQGLGLGALQGGAAGVAAAVTTQALAMGREIVGMGDTYANLDNQLKKVAKTEEQRLDLLGRTKDMAVATRSEWDATNTLYVKLTNSTKALGLTQERTLSLTETIAKAFSMSGASAEAQSGAMTQLAQAFGSGALRGDEFNSVAEAVPEILDLVAAQMGVTRGELKGLASEGKITSAVLVASFEAAKASIDAGFAKTTPTLSQSLTNFKTEMIATFGPLIRDMLPAVASALKDVAGVIKEIADGIREAKRLAGKEIAGGVTVGDVAGGVKDVGSTFGGTALNPWSYAKKIDEIVPTDDWMASQKYFLANGETFLQTLLRQADAVRDSTIAWSAFLAKTSEISARWAEADTKGEQFTKRLRDAVDALDPWSPKAQTASKDTQALADSIGSVVSILPALHDGLNNVLDAGGFTGAGSAGGLAGFGAAIRNAVTSYVVYSKDTAAGMKMWADAANDNKGPNAIADMLKAIKGPQLEFTRNLAALDALLKSGRITLLEYNTQLVKLIETFKGKDSSDWRILDATKSNETWVSLVDSVRAVADEVARAVREANAFEEASRKSREEWFAPNLDKDLAAREQRAGNSISMGMLGAERTGKAFDANAYGIDAAQAGAAYTKTWTAELERNKQKWADIDQLIQSTVRGLGDALADSAMKGKLSFDSFFQSLEQQALRLAANRLIMAMIGGIASGGDTQSALGTGATQAFQGVFGSAPGYYGGAHADGGSFRAPRTGGAPDSIPVMFHMSPGELATFHPSGMAENENGGGRPIINNQLIVQDRRRALLDALDSPEGERIMSRYILKHSGGRRR